MAGDPAVIRVFGPLNLGGSQGIGRGGDKLSMSRADDISPLQTWISETEEQEPWRGYFTNPVGGCSVHFNRLSAFT